MGCHFLRAAKIQLTLTNKERNKHKWNDTEVQTHTDVLQHHYPEQQLTSIYNDSKFIRTFL